MKLQSILAWCLLLVIVQTIVFLAIVVSWRNKRHANNAIIGAKICTDCEDLLARRDFASESLELVESLMTNGNNKTCCGEAVTLLNLAAKKKSIDNYFKQAFDRVPVEVLCDPTDPPDTTLGLAVGVVGYKKLISNGFHRLLWSNHNLSRANGDMFHLEDEGELFVHKAGKYYVSARLNCMFNTSWVAMGDTVTMQMSILSHKLGYSRVVHQTRKRLGKSPDHQISIFIVKRQISPDWNSLRDEKTWIEPVEFGALFDLSQYDRISLAISNPRLIDLNNANDQFMATFYHN